jgi:hypothetical protein
MVISGEEEEKKKKKKKKKKNTSKKKEEKKRTTPKHPSTAKKCPRSNKRLIPIIVKKSPKPLPLSTPIVLSKPPAKLPLECLPIIKSINIDNQLLSDLNKTIEEKKQEKEVLLNKLKSLNKTKKVLIMFNDTDNILYNWNEKKLSKSILFRVDKTKLKTLVYRYYDYSLNILNKESLLVVDIKELPKSPKGFTDAQKCLIDEHHRYKAIIIFFNYMLDSINNTNDFLHLYCKLTMINKSLNTIYVATFQIPRLFKLLTQSLSKIKDHTGFIKSSTYSSNPTKRGPVEHEISRLSKCIIKAKCEEGEDGNVIISSDAHIFSSDFVIKFILMVEFFTLRWPATSTHQRLDPDKPYQYLILKRKNKKTIDYLPLVKENGDLERKLSTDKMLSIPWDKQSIKSMPEFMKLLDEKNRKFKNRRVYFENLLDNMISIVFPSVNKIK